MKAVLRYNEIGRHRIELPEHKVAGSYTDYATPSFLTHEGVTYMALTSYWQGLPGIDIETVYPISTALPTTIEEPEGFGPDGH